MAGRGRGRGMSFNTENLGFKRGDMLPPPTQQPPSLFPNLEYLPNPLVSDDSQNYLLALKQELRGIMRDSKYFVKPVASKKDIVRYSDKYHTNGNSCEDNDLSNSIDFSRLPSELNFKAHKRKSVSRVKIKVNINEKIKKLENIESSTKDDEEEQEDDEKDKNEEEKSGDELEEFYDEEEQEEGTDYATSYFDNGESYLDEEEDNLDDGPVY